MAAEFDAFFESGKRYVRNHAQVTSELRGKGLLTKQTELARLC